jgi:MFS family permease
LKVLILLVAFLYWTSLYFYVPTLPIYVEQKAGGLALVGMVLAMYGLWQALVRLPLGIAADWIGRRKPFILVGLSLSAVGAWLMATSSGVPGLTLGRAITGLAAGTWVPLVVFYTSLCPSDQAVRASATMTLVNSVARMIASAANGPAQSGRRIRSGLYGIHHRRLTGGSCDVIAGEKRNPPQRPSLDQLGHFVARRDILLPSLLSAVTQYATWATTFGFLPILAGNLAPATWFKESWSV